MTSSQVIQIRARGGLTLPAKLRERYGLREGDTLALIDLGGVFVLSPRENVVDKLADELVHLREEAGLSVDDLIAGVREERQKYYVERLGGAGS